MVERFDDITRRPAKTKVSTPTKTSFALFFFGSTSVVTGIEAGVSVGAATPKGLISHRLPDLAAGWAGLGGTDLPGVGWPVVEGGVSNEILVAIGIGLHQVRKMALVFTTRFEKCLIWISWVNRLGVWVHFNPQVRSVAEAGAEARN